VAVLLWITTNVVVLIGAPHYILNDLFYSGHADSDPAVGSDGACPLILVDTSDIRLPSEVITVHEEFF
jgi:hypothetical protein